jgi:soluble P-type ATPase
VLQSSSADVVLVLLEDETLKRDQQLAGMNVDKVCAKAQQDLRRIVQNLKRQREAMVIQQGEHLVPMLEKVQRTCFASVYI